MSLGLLNGCIDELIVAGHLAKHRFYSQAAAHFRIVYESLNLVDVFHLKPELIYVWAGDDKKERRNKLNSAELRRILGKDLRDKEIFDHLSEVGSHPGFKAFQARTFVEAGTNEGENKKVRVLWAGALLKIKWFMIWPTYSYLFSFASVHRQTF